MLGTLAEIMQAMLLTNNIGTRKDIADLIKMASECGLQVIIETHWLAEANEVLYRLKNSEVEARAVLTP